ncbi:hypothetical protein [Nesterenkonia sp. DZ6]|uniref:hypothetical protein n=1 Tax=Nesterenkonia sp. DZ6 TaxID=2901229 RepID=UPI001F4C607C|nr:hypothetical protein [Nesterenkonia sp. DZ6]MCH8560850.1 hypothetical protein [Nesterenkonia sp. DZ6]
MTDSTEVHQPSLRPAGRPDRGPRHRRLDRGPTLGRALGLHVLEVMAGVFTAAETEAPVNIASRADRPSAVPLDLR